MKLQKHKPQVMLPHQSWRASPSGQGSGEKFSTRKNPEVGGTVTADVETCEKPHLLLRYVVSLKGKRNRGNYRIVQIKLLAFMVYVQKY